MMSHIAQILRHLIALPTDAIWRTLERRILWPDMGFLLDNMPPEALDSVGGGYTGWIYQQGFFGALIKRYAPRTSLRIFDFGCGYGKIAPISTFFTYPKGEYVGLDIRKKCIDFCRDFYSHLPRVRFLLSKNFNPTYSQQSLRIGTQKEDWAVDRQTFHIVISISVFTHLQETDAFTYMQRIHRVLAPQGVAILTFHIVDTPRKKPVFTSKDKPTVNAIFDFNTPLPPTYDWFTSNPKRPEDAIAVNMEGLRRLTHGQFRILSLIRGSTTGYHSPFPQDVLILRKK